jgi:aryl-alcohol dehydrogenase-like predicted oxidoreductase
MNYRPLGRTGLTVSEIGFGGGNVGGLMVRGSPQEQQEAVARALDLGITYFDTAPSYGDGRSEENLGRVFRELGREMTLGTKYRVPPEQIGEAASVIRQSVNVSLRRLQRSHLDLLQLHNNVCLEPGGRPGALSVDQVLGPVLEGLRALQAEGLVRFLGFTGLGETEAVHRLVASGAFDTVQVYFNVLNPSAGYAVSSQDGPQDFQRLIDRASEQGMAVLTIRVLAAGALAAQDERHPLASPNPGAALSTGAEYQGDLQRAKAFQSLAQELAMESTTELAVRFALSKPGISSVLVGFSDLPQIESAVRWAERGPLDEAGLKRVLSAIGGS